MKEFTRHHMRNFTAAMFVAASCTACTHLQTNPTGEIPSVRAGAPTSEGAQRGISYALPMVQYQLRITRSLESCPSGNGSPTFAVKVEANERYVAGERFEVDYQALSSIMKTTNFEMTLHDSGTIKTVNALAHDQTGAVLTDIARIGLSVATMAAGVPIPIVPAQFNASTAESFRPFNIRQSAIGGAPEVTLRCTAEAQGWLAELEAKSEAVGPLTVEIGQLSAEVTRLSAIATLEVMSTDDQAELSRTVHSLMIKERELSTLSARISFLQGKLSASEEVAWPDQAGNLANQTGILRAGPGTLRKLMSLFEIHVDGHPVTPRPADLGGTPMACGAPAQRKTASECVGDITALNLALVPSVTQGSPPATTGNSRSNSAYIAPSDRRWARGIFVREAIDGRLIICAAPAVVSGQGCSGNASPVLRDDAVIAPQLGRLRLLPFRSRPFENNHLQLSVRANGFIEQFSYGEESSAAAASSTLAGMAERVQATLETIETERRSDVQYARDTVAYQRGEAAAARTEAAAVRAEQLADLTHRVEMLRRERERLTEQAALEGTAGRIQAQAAQAAIDAEVAMLQSRIARLRATTELAAAPSPATP